MKTNKTTFSKKDIGGNWRSIGDPIKILDQGFECICGSIHFELSREVFASDEGIRRIELTCRDCGRIFDLDRVCDVDRN